MLVQLLNCCYFSLALYDRLSGLGAHLGTECYDYYMNFNDLTFALHGADYHMLENCYIPYKDFLYEKRLSTEYLNMNDDFFSDAFNDPRSAYDDKGSPVLNRTDGFDGGCVDYRYYSLPLGCSVRVFHRFKGLHLQYSGTLL